MQKEIVERTKCPAAAIRKELVTLSKAGIIKAKQVAKEVQVVKGKKAVTKAVQGSGYALNEKFPYLDPLKSLLTVTSLQADDVLAKRLSGAGKLKLLVVAGVFIQNWDSRVDLLVVGDDINLPKLENAIKTIESEIGKEIAYSAFETQDFEYRYGIHDRLVRDILDYPHMTLLNRSGIQA